MQGLGELGGQVPGFTIGGGGSTHPPRWQGSQGSPSLQIKAGPSS
jgi:hypothetical protein